jgi:hypothetical protein
MIAHVKNTQPRTSVQGHSGHRRHSGLAHPYPNVINLSRGITNTLADKSVRLVGTSTLVFL